MTYTDQNGIEQLTSDERGDAWEAEHGEPKNLVSSDNADEQRLLDSMPSTGSRVTDSGRHTHVYNAWGRCRCGDVD